MSETDNEKISIGAQLAQARARRGQDVNNIAARLRIRADYLIALEADDYAALPGPAYLIGFLRSYAEYLGLDGASIAKNLQEKGDTNFSFVSFPEYIPTRKRLQPYIILAIIVTITMMLVTGFYIDQYIRQSPPSLSQLRPPLQDNEHKLRNDDNIPHIVPQTAINIHPTDTQNILSPQNQNIAIRARARTWMRIEDAHGKIIFSSIIRSGESFKLPPAFYYILTAQNGGALEYIIDKTVIGPIGRDGQSLRNHRIALDKIIDRGQ